MKTQRIFKITILQLLLISLMLNLASGLTIEDSISTPQEIQPGEQVTVQLTIENNLGVDASNVAVRLNLDDISFAPYQSSNEKTIDEIETDDDERVSFDLISFSDTEPGTYKIPVEISYNINNNGTIQRQTSQGLISLIVNASPKIDLSAENSVLIKGQRSELGIRITNSGLGDAKFLKLSIGSLSNARIVNSDMTYIGNIDSDDFETVDFEIIVNENAGSTITLPVTLEYLDSRNREVSETKSLSLKVYSPEEAVQLGLISRSNLPVIILVLAVFVVLFFVYRVIRKRRKKKL